VQHGRVALAHPPALGFRFLQNVLEAWMKLGIFLPNGQNGYVLSKGGEQFEATYEHCAWLSKEAERIGLDFILSMIKYRGFGGETGYWDSCIDSISLASALAVETSRVEIFATVSTVALHPVVAAKMIATLEDISKGRGGVNLVTGWNRGEYEQMKMWPSEDYYDRRYDYASEYVEIMRSLWRDGQMTFKGEYFELDDCRAYPTTKRHIPIVCAGQSPRGMRFTAEHGDYNFVSTNGEALRTIVGTVKEASAAARRKVGTVAVVAVIAAPTDAEADRRCQEILDQADLVAIGNMTGSAFKDTNVGGISAHLQKAITAPVEKGNMVFNGFPVLKGSYESVARQIEAVEATGADGLLITFPNFGEGMKMLETEILPRLRPRQSKAVA